jgi:hypothetical protein
VATTILFNETHQYRSKKGDQRMNTNSKTVEMKDRKVIFSTLWIFAMFNYLYADVFGSKDPEALKQLITGTGPLQMTEGFLLGAAILMEMAITMVLLSRILKYRANRWANIIVGIIHTAAVSLSLFVEVPTLYYMFFAAIEIPCTLFIVWYAWKWRNPEGQPS